MDLLVCYDIRQARRLVKVHRCMRRWGTPLQYSVFYCRLMKSQRNTMEVELRSLIDERVDDVRVYSLKTSLPIVFMGQKPFPEGVMVLGPSPLREAGEASV